MQSSNFLSLVGERPQRTISNLSSFTGVGVHTGDSVTITLHPAPAGSGIRFLSAITGIEIPAHGSNVSDTRRSTTLASGNATISTVEHLLAAVRALQVDNILIEVSGPELPIGDGSAQPFIDLIDRAGVVEQRETKPIFGLQETVRMQIGEATIEAAPSNEFRVSYTLHYPGSPRLQGQKQFFVVNEATFRAEIAPARTFALYSEVEALLNAGLIKGGSLDNALVIDGDTVLSAGGLRYEDEMVRHKILDVVGDFSLLGIDLRTHLTVVRGGHEINCALVNKLVANCTQELADVY